jgi:hypothetical protein
MAILVSQVTVNWSGFQGAPGWSRLNFFELTGPAAVQAAVDAVRVFFFAMRNQLKTDWTLSVSPTVQSFDVLTGDLVFEQTATTTPGVITGLVANTTGFAGGVGFNVRWNTGQIAHGRKVVGRTFIVPAVLAAEFDGTVLESVRTSAQSAGALLIANATAHLCVWHKQFDTSTPPKQIGGSTHAVSSCVVPDNVSTLRTRRY